jgi:hypothetical protein
MDLFVKEYEVTKPTIGLLAIKIKSAVGLPMNKYMLIQNNHQLKMVEEDREKYKLVNLCLQTADAEVKFTSNGIVGEKLPVSFITKYLNTRREINRVTIIATKKGYRFVGLRNYTQAELTKILKLYDEHIKQYLLGKTTRQSPNDFIFNNLKNL